MLDTRKSATTMELNEAIWMMEADFNYYHGFTEEFYTEFFIDSTFIKIPFNGSDLVPVSKLKKIHSKVNNSIVASYEKCPFENKRPYLYDLELQSTIDGVQLAIYTTIGKTNSIKSVKINSVGGSDPFSDNDYWSIIYSNKGNCAGSGGVTTGTAIHEWHESVSNYFKPEGSNWFWTDIQNISEWIYPADDSRLYVYDHHCLSPSEMNQSHYGIVGICGDVIPTGRTLIYVAMADRINNTLDGKTNYFIALWYFKHAKVWYAPRQPVMAALMSDPL
jgi:hypothetical protein